PRYSLVGAAGSAAGGRGPGRRVPRARPRAHGRRASVLRLDLALPVEPAVRGEPSLAARCGAVRTASVALAAPLSAEDAMLQSMEDASPAKWHLAHTTWFFEHFVLAAAGVAPLQPDWHYLFNSYYDSAGPRQPRPRRGQLSRPPLEAVL